MTSQVYLYNEGDSNSLDSDTITTIYKNNEGILWIGTNNGISVLDLNKQFFRSYSGTLAVPYSVFWMPVKILCGWNQGTIHSLQS
jgi:ligand-binding sensor domain-containing protein